MCNARGFTIARLRPYRILSPVSVSSVLVVLLTLCLHRSIATADDESSPAWEPNQYPNLMSSRESKYCTGPSWDPPSSICDPEMILSKSQAIPILQLSPRTPMSYARGSTSLNIARCFLSMFRSLSSVGMGTVLVVLLCVMCLNRLIATADDESSFEWEPDSYPNLMSTREAKYCTGPTRNPPSAICDPEILLSKSQATKLDQLIDQSQNSTACLCPPCPPNKTGLVIKVALLALIKRHMNVSQDEDIRHFADQIRSNWNYGGSCKHDVLIFYCMSFKRLYISTGDKARRVIDEDEAQKIVSQNQKHFGYGNLYEGLESVIKAVKHRSQTYDPRFDILSLKHGMWITIGAAVASLLVIIVLVWLCIRRETRKGIRPTRTQPKSIKTSDSLSQSSQGRMISSHNSSIENIDHKKGYTSVSTSDNMA